MGLKIFRICFENLFLVNRERAEMPLRTFVYPEPPYDFIKCFKPIFRHFSIKNFCKAKLIITCRAHKSATKVTTMVWPFSLNYSIPSSTLGAVNFRWSESLLCSAGIKTHIC